MHKFLLGIVMCTLSISAFSAERFLVGSRYIYDTELRHKWYLTFAGSTSIYEEAKKKCGNLAGFLPNEKELLSLLRNEKPITPFDQLDNKYWTRDIFEKKSAMVIDFSGRGFHMYHPFDNKANVICVRLGA